MDILRCRIVVYAIALVACVAAGQADCVAQSNSTAITDRYLTPVQTELTTKIDTKDASPGQAVTARTTAPVELADGTKVPQGTVLSGHVTQVQAHTEEQPGAVLGLAFDQATLKGGQILRLRSVVQMVAPPVQVAVADRTMDPVYAGRPTVPMGVSGAGAGVIGGAPRGVGPTGRSAVGSLATPTRGALGTTAPVAQAGVNVSGVSATKLPGVMLSTNVPANASGTLTAAGRNISLEKGTRIVLGVIRQ